MTAKATAEAPGGSDYVVACGHVSCLSLCAVMRPLALPLQVQRLDDVIEFEARRDTENPMLPAVRSVLRDLEIALAAAPGP